MGLAEASEKENFPRVMRDLDAQQSGGKGDRPRHLDSKEAFDEGWERIFGEKETS